MFEQVFVSIGNLQAVKKLWAMRLDGSQSETQRIHFDRCLKRSPSSVFSAVKLAGDRRVQGLVDELKTDVD